MGDQWGVDVGKTKKEGVADAINRLLNEMVLRCTEGETVKDRFWVGVIGYGKEGKAGPAFGGKLSQLTPTCAVCKGQHPGLVPISEVAKNPEAVEPRMKKEPDGAGGVIEIAFDFAVYFYPVADGGTPMCAALRLAQPILQSWVNTHPNCFPPTVINITDGESTDGNPSTLATSLTELASFCRETAKKPTVAIWASPNDMTQSLVS